ncbi:MAG: hypothetical protein LW855_08400 [Alphaproteobacteria bacterium]|jgi:hypothetical protein|nr:hypothetical protein [Alphaproteobacteria bacterium]
MVQNGDAGRTVIWADGETSFYGNISARGGIILGSGGFVETSGKSVLNFDGTVNTLATKGNDGLLLLDPTDLTISSGVDGGVTSTGSTPNLTRTATSGATSILNVSTLITLLASNNVTVATNAAGSGGTGTGLLTVSNPIVWNSIRTLTLNSNGDTVINAAITNSGTGGLNISAGGTINVNASVSVGSTGISLFGGTGVTVNPGTGSLASTGGISLYATTGNITVNNTTPTTLFNACTGQASTSCSTTNGGGGNVTVNGSMTVSGNINLYGTTGL